MTVASVLIAVITYRRPDSLARLLKSICELPPGPKWRVAVVDNDPLESARTAVPQDPRFSYHREPTPGIPAARNQCLQLITEDDDAIVFVDDDETVTSPWLMNLVSCANKYGAPIVAGPVLSDLPADAPSWIVRGQFFQNRIHATGSGKAIPATNNVLVLRALLESHDIRFEEKYTDTGGSDSDFFMRLRAVGANWVWCADAAVIEYVQTERLTGRWLLKRYARGGEVYTRLPHGKSTTRLLLEATAYEAAALAMLPIALLRPRFRRHALVGFARGIGIARGLTGRSTNEYRRSA